MSMERTNYKRRLALVVCAAVSVLTIAACGSSSSGKPAADGSTAPQPLVSIKFSGGASPNGTTANIAYGIKEGIFKKYGFDVEMVFPANSSSTSVIPLLAKGTITMAYGYPAAMMANYDAGVKTLGIFAYLEKNPTGIIVPTKLGINTPQDLKGKTIAELNGSVNGRVLPEFLKYYGLKASDVKVVGTSLPALTTSVLTGTVDGAMVQPLSVGPNLASKGMETHSFFFSDAGIEQMQGVIAVGADWAQEHKAQLPNLVKALQESLKLAVANPDVAAKDLISFAPATAPTPDVTKQQFLNQQEFLDTPSTKGQPLGYMAPKDWEDTLAFGIKYLGAKQMDTSVLYTNEYIH